MFINDVGYATWEEIDTGRPGANYGWPISEGPVRTKGFTRPIAFYHHGTRPDQGYAITGGDFYDPTFNRFPASYRDSYFFADYVGGWIHVYNPATNAITGFASNTGLKPIDIDVSPGGDLYFLGRAGKVGQPDGIYKIEYAPNSPPVVTQPPADILVTNNGVATFTVSASGTSPFSYQWLKNGQILEGQTGPTLSLTGTLADNGSEIVVVVSNAYGVVASPSATLRVTASRPPSASVTAPNEGDRVRVGQVVTFIGDATDPEDGVLPASAFTWQVDLDNNGTHHPILPATSGIKTGSFQVPSTSDLAGGVAYHITLTVVDSSGLTTTTVRTVILGA
jgi:hypothetical protein